MPDTKMYRGRGTRKGRYTNTKKERVREGYIHRGRGTIYTNAQRERDEKRKETSKKGRRGSVLGLVNMKSINEFCYKAPKY